MSIRIRYDDWRVRRYVKANPLAHTLDADTGELCEACSFTNGDDALCRVYVLDEHGQMIPAPVGLRLDADLIAEAMRGGGQ